MTQKQTEQFFAERRKMETRKLDFKRIAFWSKQPIFRRDEGGLLDIVERANRLKRMHIEFNTLPDPPTTGVDRMTVESRNMVYEMMCQCEN